MTTHKATVAWAIKYPDGEFHPVTYRTKADATMGCYPAPTWKQAYAKGYRLAKVKLVEIVPMRGLYRDDDPIFSTSYLCGL